MPLGDTIYTPVLHPAGEAEEKPALYVLNEELRKINRRLDMLEGRQGQIALRDSVALLGVPAPTAVSGSSVLYHDSSTSRLRASEDGVTYYDVLTRERCKVACSGISVANDTIVLMTFDVERYDPIGMHSTTVNNSRIIIPTAGTYHVGAGISFAADPTATRACFMGLNGVTGLVTDSRPAVPTAGIGTVVTLSTDHAFAKNDYVEITVYQNSGGPVVASGTFWCHRIA